ncbi:MAG: hypothetical protein J07HX64_02137 [halophilic archaeon J07HX64]|jgi:hypothetical protein|nr:MAG: hypothetical protein J07HX64_02137 [halophilic archaeon J07HX64]
MHLLQPVCKECGTAHDWSCIVECRDCGRGTDVLDGPCACGVTHPSWRAIERAARTEGPVTVAKDAVERPSEVGYRRHVGTVRGQWADYRRVLDSGGEFHVRTYLHHYELHVDEVSAIDEPTKHTLRYGPRAAVTTTVDLVRSVAGTTRQVGGLLGSSVIPDESVPESQEQ